MFFLFLVAVLLGLAACGGGSPPAGTLRIGLLATQDYLSYFVIRERSLARSSGLAFTETTYAGGDGIIEAIANGDIDIGISAIPPILRAGASGTVPSKAVVIAANNYADPMHPGLGVIVGAGIRGWRDLEGRQIAVNSLGSITAAAIAGRLRLEGVSGYDLVELGFPNQGLAVSGGMVAASVMAEPYLSQSLLRGDGTLLGWVVGGSPLESALFTAYVCSRALVRDRPQSVAAFLRATRDAVRWINRNQAKAREILANRLGLSPQAGAQVNLLDLRDDARIHPEELESMLPLLLEVGMLKSRVAGSSLLDPGPLERVLAEER